MTHESRGRLRLRLSWLREARDEAVRLSDRLAALDGVDEVRIRPFTGSVLVRYDPSATDAATLQAAVLMITGVSHVRAQGEETPAELVDAVRRSFGEGSRLSRLLAEAFEGLHVDFLAYTGGRVSLGALAALSFWAGAVAKIFSEGEIQIPSWHELAWLGWRSFSDLELHAIEHAGARPVEELLDSASPARGD